MKLREKFLKAILVLGFIGLVTSVYLIKNHYDSPVAGAVCDFGGAVSCSLVNTSVYSELFNVPVALFGAIWFAFLLLMSWRMLKNKALASVLLGWSVLGSLFVVYMIVAEIILKAVCPFCTLVHVIVFVSLVLSIVLFKRSKKKDFFKVAKPWIAMIVIVNLIPLVLFNLPSEEKNYDNVAKCLTEKGVRMYGSFLCGVCAKTRDVFGDSFQYVVEIECHPRGENPQTELCLEMNIEKTPTWILEKDGVEVKRIVGFQSPEALAEFAGCVDG